MKQNIHNINSLDEIVIIDTDFIRLGESGNGGWNKKQFNILGINWPPKKGWKERDFWNDLI